MELFNQAYSVICNNATVSNCATDCAEKMAKLGPGWAASGATWVQETAVGYASKTVRLGNKLFTEALIGNDQSNIPLEQRYSAHQSLLMVGLMMVCGSNSLYNLGKAFEYLPLPWRSEYKFEYIKVSDSTADMGELTKVPRSLATSAKHAIKASGWGLGACFCLTAIFNQVNDAKNHINKTVTIEPK